MNSFLINDFNKKKQEQEEIIEMLKQMQERALKIEFEAIWENINHKDKIKKNFVKKILSQVIECYSQQVNPEEQGLKMHEYMQLKEMIPYIAYEHFFRTSHLEDAVRSSLQEDREYQELIINEVVTKLMHDDNMQTVTQVAVTKHSPEIANLRMFASFVECYYIGIIQSSKANEDSEKDNVLFSLVTKALATVEAILDLLSQEYSAEAYVLWRTLHELECTIMVLNQNDDNVAKAYYEHLKYYKVALADENDDKEMTDELEKEMKKYKIKNKANYINLGWVMQIPGFSNSNLTFKDSLSMLSNQQERYAMYKDASMLVHSSALHIVCDKGAFFCDCIMQLYISFFSIEEVASSIIAKYANELPEEVESYMEQKKQFSKDIFETFILIKMRIDKEVYLERK